MQLTLVIGAKGIAVELGTVGQRLPRHLAVAVTDAKETSDAEDNGGDTAGDLVNVEMIDAAEFSPALVVDKGAFDIVSRNDGRRWRSGAHGLLHNVPPVLVDR